MLSVVVPTHNRADSAVRLARALEAHETSDIFETVFVLDGCTDGTREALESLALSRPFKVVETPGLGPGGARNAGVAASEGDLLLFIDDDVFPLPGMLDAHLAMHSQGERLGAIGPYPYAPEMPVNLLDTFIRDWWQGCFNALADTSHVYTYRDCLTGNFSLSRNDFESLGGFDEVFGRYGREDWELGLRLLKSGVKLTFAPDAMAYHYPVNRPKSLLRKWYHSGRSDIFLVQKHPEVFETLPMWRFCRKDRRLQALLKVLSPLFYLGPDNIISLLGSIFERNPDRLCNRRLLSLWGKSQNLAYLFGLISAAGSPKQLYDFLHSRMDRSEWPRSTFRIEDVDLPTGLHEISDIDKRDKLFLVPRAGGSMLDWIEVRCWQGQGWMSPAEIAGRASGGASWQAWRSLVAPPGGAIKSTGEADWLAWKRLREELPTISTLTLDELASKESVKDEASPRLLVIIFTDSQDEVPAEPCSTFGDAQVVYLSTEGGDLGRKLMTVVSVCDADVVALLEPKDLLDPAWTRTVLRHFHDPQLACVLSPVVLRDIRTRSGELYHSLLDFDRARLWSFCDLNDWGNPAYILNTFNVSCHRLVVSKMALESCRKSYAANTDDYSEVLIRILGSLLHNFAKVIYEPKAVIWRNPQVHTSQVCEMAVKQSYMVGRMTSERLKSGKPGRRRAFRMLPKLMRYHTSKLTKCARGKIDWPLSFAAAEASAGMRGIIHGLVGGSVNRSSALHVE